MKTKTSLILLVAIGLVVTVGSKHSAIAEEGSAKHAAAQPETITKAPETSDIETTTRQAIGLSMDNGRLLLR